MSDLGHLLSGARAAGLEVDIRVDGMDACLPTDTDVAAYRLVQEALTNVLKHAPGATAQVTIRAAPSHLDVIVVNGRSAQPAGEATDDSQGLRGMRQRIEACGGRLDWGRQTGGGFEVRARFPIRVELPVVSE